MTPDMKRLCEAAQEAVPANVPCLQAEAAEVIVRAVLMALPDVDGGERYAAGEWSRRNADAMVSDILAEPEGIGGKDV